MDMDRLFSLDGKVALVTGGAYGIGFAIAEALAGAGAKIAFNCRSQSNLDRALSSYASKGIDARGYIATPQTAPLRERQPDGSRHPFDQFIVSKTPAGRWGDPEDLKGPAVFLASDASDLVNGHILYVDGGILAYIGKQPE